MQRTVNGFKVTFAKVELDENNNVKTTLATQIFDIRDEAQCRKYIGKKYPGIAVVKMEKISRLYVLDDEIFFKYAKPTDIVTNDHTEEVTE